MIFEDLHNYVDSAPYFLTHFVANDQRPQYIKLTIDGYLEGLFYKKASIISSSNDD